MRHVCCTIFAALILVASSPPAWAQGRAHNSHGHDHQRIKERIHQKLVNYRLRFLKLTYEKSSSEVQQMFLEYIGTTCPSSDEQLSALREAYEAQIAELNATVSTLQQENESLAEQMNAACEERIAQSLAECQAAAQNELNELNAAHQAEMESLTAQLNTACDQRLEDAYLEWQASVDDPCQGTVPQVVSSWRSGNISPYALDIDNAGNVVALDRDSLAVAKFDPTGGTILEWNPGSLSLPVDIGVDSSGSIYVLDQQAAVPLQKFGPDGTPASFATSITIFSPIGLYIDDNDTIYVTDRGGAYGGRIIKLDVSGNLLGIFGELAELEMLDYNDIAVDKNNQTIHVVTGGFRNLVATFDLDGNFLSAWEGDFRAAGSIAIASNGDLFIADTYGNQIDRYNRSGSLQYSFADDISRPYHIVTNDSGRLYAGDHANMQVVIYE